MTASAMTDAVVAAADLIGRAGALEFEIAWDCPHTPDQGDDHNCPDITWTCSAKYRGHRIFTDGHPYPGQAANALALKLLDGALCRCDRPVSLFGEPGCPWTLDGQKWTPGCDMPPKNMSGLGIERGDLAGMNRAARRRLNRKRNR